MVSKSLRQGEQTYCWQRAVRSGSVIAVSSPARARVGAFCEKFMTTPTLHDSEVLRFCNGISSEPLILVDVKPQAGLEPLNCHNNVDLVVARFGGSVLKGWHITIWPKVFIEAECHVVWMKPDKSIIDPTPHIHGFMKIAFLPDRSLGEWDFPDNKNLPLADDSMITDFLDCARQVRNQGGFGIARRSKKLLQQLVSRYGAEPVGG